MIELPSLRMSALILMPTYAILGGGVKYIDDAFDEPVFNKKIAYVLSVVCGILMGWIMIHDVPSRAIFIAMNMGLVFTKKIDVLPFKIGLGLSFGLPIINALMTGDWHVDLILCGLLMVGGTADELANDYVDKHNVNIVAYNFFRWRCVMKVAVLAAAWLGWVTWIHFLAFLCFDVAYASVQVWSLKLKPRLMKRAAEINAGPDGKQTCT